MLAKLTFLFILFQIQLVANAQRDCGTELSRVRTEKSYSSTLDKINSSQIDTINLESEYLTLFHSHRYHEDKLHIDIYYKGEFIGQIDTDPTGHPQYLETHVTLLSHKFVGIGRLAYLTLAYMTSKQGKRIVSSQAPSDNARDLWNRFVSTNLASMVDISENGKHAITSPVRPSLHIQKVLQMEPELMHFWQEQLRPFSVGAVWELRDRFKGQ